MNVIDKIKANVKKGVQSVSAVMLGTFLFCGNAQAVERGTQGLNAIKSMMDTWTPIVAGIAVIMCALGYWFDWVSRDFLIKFAKGMLILAMGSWLISLFIGG